MSSKSVLEFYLTELRDFSAKVEVLDKKMQYSIQLFGVVSNIIISIFLSFFGSDSKTKSLIIIIAFFIIILTGEFIYFYNIAGLKTHIDYINRLNKIRLIILKEFNKTEQEIEEYGYTGNIKINKGGMNQSLIRLITAFLCIVLVIMWICIYQFLELLQIDQYISIECCILGSAITIGLIIAINKIQYYKKMHKYINKRDKTECEIAA